MWYDELLIAHAALVVIRVSSTGQCQNSCSFVRIISQDTKRTHADGSGPLDCILGCRWLSLSASGVCPPWILREFSHTISHMTAFKVYDNDLTKFHDEGSAEGLPKLSSEDSRQSHIFLQMVSKFTQVDIEATLNQSAHRIDSWYAHNAQWYMSRSIWPVILVEVTVLLCCVSVDWYTRSQCPVIAINLSNTIQVPSRYESLNHSRFAYWCCKKVIGPCIELLL